MRITLSAVVLAASLPLPGSGVVAQQPAANPRQQPGAPITLYAPEQHDLYDGHFVLSANRVYMVGGLNDPVGWDHMDNEAKTVKPVSGTAEIDVNDLTNTGKFETDASALWPNISPGSESTPSLTTITSMSPTFSA